VPSKWEILGSFVFVSEELKQLLETAVSGPHSRAQNQGEAGRHRYFYPGASLENQEQNLGILLQQRCHEEAET